MTPTYIKNEVIHRINSAADIDAEVIRTLGIQPDAEPLEWEETEERRSAIFGPDDRPISGHIRFELTVCTFGETTVRDCRAKFLVNLRPPEDDVADPEDRIIDGLLMHYELLDWSEQDQLNEETGEPLRARVPRWSKVDLFPLIPFGVQCDIDEQIRQHALAVERSKELTP